MLADVVCGDVLLSRWLCPLLVEVEWELSRVFSLRTLIPVVGILVVMT